MMPSGAASLADVVVLGSAAALTAVLGPSLLGASDGPPVRTIGFADALAAGMMLGIGYTLMTWGVSRSPVGATVGAAAGVAATYWVHVRLGIGDADAAAIGKNAFVAAVVHATSEGVALGAAAALGRTVAIVVAGTLAIHNISESAVLASRLPPESSNTRHAAMVGVASNVPQIILGVLAFMVAGWVPPLLGPLLGASFGALVYLCFAELLPDSYRTAGRSSIAVVVTVAAGVVALVSGGA
jgi:ZIP family zinc transporter